MCFYAIDKDDVSIVNRDNVETAVRNDDEQMQRHFNGSLEIEVNKYIYNISNNLQNE